MSKAEKKNFVGKSSFVSWRRRIRNNEQSFDNWFGNLRPASLSRLCAGVPSDKIDCRSSLKWPEKFVRIATHRSVSANTNFRSLRSRSTIPCWRKRALEAVSSALNGLGIIPVHDMFSQLHTFDERVDALHFHVSACELEHVSGDRPANPEVKRELVIRAD